SQSLSVRDTIATSLSATQSGITLHPDPLSELPIPDARGLVFDSFRNLLYVMTAHGTVERYDPITETLLAPLAIGVDLWGADLTADGSALYVAEAAAGPGGGILRKIDLATGAAAVY